MNRIVATMDDLPELPFERVLGYLSLEDRLKARAVSRRWYHKINSFRVKSLFYSDCPSDFIIGKRRLVSGAFAQNFISPSRIVTFFDTFGQSILSSLKHLRLCDLDLRESNETAFVRTLNSFGKLEDLNIVRVQCSQQREFKLTLPMLTSIHMEELSVNRKLTLDAPRLREIRLMACSGLKLNIVHGDSIERFVADDLRYTEIKKLKNLQYLYADIMASILSSLELLKEIHTYLPGTVAKLFDQKRRSGRTALKIYLYGLLLNGPDDPAMNAFRDSSDILNPAAFDCLAENPSRLADEIPFYLSLDYSAVERVDPELEVDLLKRFTDLIELRIDSPIQNIQRFLNLLKNCENIVQLWFDSDQPQDLFDQLPEYCAVQWLTLDRSPSDLTFLFQLKHLVHLHLSRPFDGETVRRAFEELPALSSFGFRHDSKMIKIELSGREFRVTIGKRKTTFSGLNAAIEFIAGKERPKKRKADELKQ